MLSKIFISLTSKLLCQGLKIPNRIRQSCVACPLIWLPFNSSILGTRLITNEIKIFYLKSIWVSKSERISEKKKKIPFRKYYEKNTNYGNCVIRLSNQIALSSMLLADDQGLRSCFFDVSSYEKEMNNPS